LFVLSINKTPAYSVFSFSKMDDLFFYWLRISQFFQKSMT
jgi:hypothetical protein